MIIRSHDTTHFGVFAATGAGKGVGSVIPLLRSYAGSTVNVDPKGENHRLTAEHRQTRFGHRTVQLAPFSGVSDAMNPFYFLDPKSPLLLDKCRDLSNMLIFRKGSETDPHWNDRAEGVWSVFSYYVAACETDPSRRNLLSVRAIVRSLDAYTASLHVMKQHGGMLKDQADSLASLRDRELGSVLSTLDRQTAWMDSPPVAACLKRCTFDPLDLRSGKLDVYLTLPPERLERLAPLMRLWLGTMLGRLIDGEAGERQPVLFLVDEAAHLGRMQILEDAITLLRGYGIRIGLYFQSINQLQKCYGDNAATVLDNLGTQVYFGISNAFETAEAISKRIGDCTILQRSINDTKGHSRSTGTTGQGETGNASSSVSVTTSEMQRRWAKAEEIMTLPDDLALVFHRNLPVIPVKLCKYYASPAFRGSRSGEDAGLGLAAGVMAALLLAVSLVLSGVVACLPCPAYPATRVPALPAASLPPADALRRTGVRPPLPSRSPRRDRLPSRSGFLVPIR